MISGLPVSRLKALLVALLLVLAPLAALAQTSPDAPSTETTESSTTSQGLDAAVSSALSAASGAIQFSAFSHSFELLSRDRQVANGLAVARMEALCRAVAGDAPLRARRTCAGSGLS